MLISNIEALCYVYRDAVINCIKAICYDRASLHFQTVSFINFSVATSRPGLPFIHTLPSKSSAPLAIFTYHDFKQLPFRQKWLNFTFVFAITQNTMKYQSKWNGYRSCMFHCMKMNDRKTCILRDFFVCEKYMYGLHMVFLISN